MMLLVIVGICVLISAMFSGIEAGILSVNRVRLEHQARLKEAAAIRLNRLLERPERLLVTVLLVTNFMNICAVGLSTRAIVHELGPWGYALSFVVWLPVYLGIQLLPKSIFRRFPYRALAFFSEALRIADLVLSPLYAVGSWIYNLFFAKIGGETKQISIAREDFKYLTLESERAGKLGKVAREMIHKVVDFRGVTARDVMVARESVRTIKAGSSVDELVAMSREFHLDRLPVVSEAGEIVSLVNVFEVLLDRQNGNQISVFARRIVTVAPEEPAANIIRKLRAARGHIAAVQEKNQTIGFVSLEDLFRRLIGAGA